MGKAKLKGTFSVTEWFGEDYDYYIEDDLKVFKKGTVVEVLKEAKFHADSRQFVIYSEELNESTVVHEGLLEFI